MNPQPSGAAEDFLVCCTQMSSDTVAKTLFTLLQFLDWTDPDTCVCVWPEAKLEGNLPQQQREAQ